MASQAPRTWLASFSAKPWLSMAQFVCSRGTGSATQSGPARCCDCEAKVIIAIIMANKIEGSEIFDVPSQPKGWQAASASLYTLSRAIRNESRRQGPGLVKAMPAQDSSDSRSRSRGRRRQWWQATPPQRLRVSESHGALADSPWAHGQLP